MKQPDILETITVEDLDKLCRFCLQSLRRKVKIDIFQDRNPGGRVIEQVRTFLALNVSESDGLPRSICVSCTKKLDSFDKFREMCEKSESFLMTRLASIRSGDTPMSENKISEGENRSAVTEYLSSINPLDIVYVKCDSGKVEDAEDSFNIIHLAKGEGEKLDTTFEQVSIENSRERISYETDIIRDRDQNRSKADQNESCSGDITTMISVKLEADTCARETVKSDKARICDIVIESDDNLANIELSPDRNEQLNSKELTVASKEGCEEVIVFDPGDDYHDHVNVVANTESNTTMPSVSKKIASSDMNIPNVGSALPGPSVERIPGAEPSYSTKSGRCVARKKCRRNHVPSSADLSDGSQELKRDENTSKHYDILEGPPKRFVCNQCGKKFKYRSQIAAHLRIHFGSRDHVCMLCGLTFLEKHNLKKHILIHLGTKEHICHICGRRFTHYSGLYVHLQIHRNDRRHGCSLCGKKFLMKSELDRHFVSSHTKEKNVLCRICGKPFYDKGSVSQHMRRVHVSVRKFECRICGKSFKANNTLTTHMRIHSDLRAFKCTVCNKDFKYKRVCQDHMKTHFKNTETDISKETGSVIS